jgi:predicted component of type VI protein secretion system
VITIGRSIDCTLQLSWDTTGVVAPVQAELRYQGNFVRLYALEDGVYLKDSKPLEVGKCYQLYHGDTFEIGRTTFTYLEKDL